MTNIVHTLGTTLQPSGTLIVNSSAGENSTALVPSLTAPDLEKNTQSPTRASSPLSHSEQPKLPKDDSSEILHTLDTSLVFPSSTPTTGLENNSFETSMQPRSFDVLINATRREDSKQDQDITTRPMWLCKTKETRSSTLYQASAHEQKEHTRHAPSASFKIAFLFSSDDINEFSPAQVKS